MHMQVVARQLAYPAQALENGIQVTVYLSCVVDNSGG